MTPIQMDILRRVLLPVLADDECYPPGELPRRMTDDEVRDGTGQAFWMALRSGVVIIGASYDWVPGGQAADNHPAHIPSQLARLQAFWDANQPKEAELNLRWSTGRRWVHVAWGDQFCFYVGAGWNAENALSPSQRATVEAFFAAGPPVELAEDECESVDWRGDRFKMRVVPDGLELTQVTGLTKGWRAVFHPGTLKDTAAKHPDPLGWPRALAYFDRHVKREPTFARCPTCGQPGDADHCPARVTDVRFVAGYPGQCVAFEFEGLTYTYNGVAWHSGLKLRLHPSDIALIERCWAEGRLGEREVLADDGTVLAVEFDAIEYEFVGRFKGGLRSYIVLDFPNDATGYWTWPSCKPGGLTIHDPTQRARVRAIVAALKDSPKADDGRCAVEPGSAQKQMSATREAPSAVLTEADSAESPVVGSHGSVSPSGEVKAPGHHDLKCWPIPFAAIASGRKTFEWRKDDRDFQEGDAVTLREWRFETSSYTGAYIECRIGYILRGAFGVPDGYCVFSLEKPSPELEIAALSDHIRRVEPSLAEQVLAELRALKEPAPDLTELREALADLGERHNIQNARKVIEAARKLCAAERLVGK